MAKLLLLDWYILLSSIMGIEPLPILRYTKLALIISLANLKSGPVPDKCCLNRREVAEYGKNTARGKVAETHHRTLCCTAAVR